MQDSLKKIMQGYQAFRQKYAHGDKSVMEYLHIYGQKPKIMVVACCDSRVDPALILQCDPGDLFVVRNVANIVPPYENDAAHHGTSAALEFAICSLQVKHLILLGHSQCGGIQALLNSKNVQEPKDDFITNWVTIIKHAGDGVHDLETCAKHALNESYKNCLTFPWIKEKNAQKELSIHLWYFDIQDGLIYNYQAEEDAYVPLDTRALAQMQ